MSSRIEFLLFQIQIQIQFSFVDVNECDQPGRPVCQHTCVNTVTSYYCQCDPGYKLHSDRSSCLGGCSIFNNWPHKFHNAPVPYPTMHHFGTEMCAFLFQNGVLWDMGQVYSRICEIGLLTLKFKFEFEFEFEFEFGLLTRDPFHKGFMSL